MREVVTKKGGRLKVKEKGDKIPGAGRKKGVPNAKTIWTFLLSLTADEIDERIGKTLTEAEALALAMLKEAKSGNVAAYNAIIDRMEGKPTQTIELNDNRKTVDELFPPEADIVKKANALDKP